LRLLFFGTPEYAVPSLRALAATRHPIVGVLSQPDRPSGRGRTLAPTPVHAAADGLGVPVLQPDKVGSDEALAWIGEQRPDLGVVVAFGQFIPRKVRELPALGLINGHASLLPKYRGAAPIPYAVLGGEAKTGITVMRVEKQMDAGDWCLMRELEIGPDETAGQLSQRLSRLCAEALVEAVDRIADGSAEFQAQDATRATLAPKIDREFARIDWTRPVCEVLRRIRASTPWPGADLELVPSGRRLRLVEVRAGGAGDARPGTLWIDGRISIAAGGGWVEVRRLQVPGKRVVDAAEFLRGARLEPGERVAGT
jgi:methionyl-tRNA formyltransferase